MALLDGRAVTRADTPAPNADAATTGPKLAVVRRVRELEYRLTPPARHDGF